jgi:hypothetical protein
MTVTSKDWLNRNYRISRDCKMQFYTRYILFRSQMTSVVEIVKTQRRRTLMDFF